MAKYEVKAPVGGSVWSHSVSVGQHISAGTVLLIAEVMKTEWPLTAPMDAVVTWLRGCGETIEADDVVAILEVA
jgi:3-methylcrotonyl-CoA carboxylase alpha subunit